MQECQEYKGYKWQCLRTQSPTQQHSEPSQKFLCGPSHGPPAPQDPAGQRVGQDKGGGGAKKTSAG